MQKFVTYINNCQVYMNLWLPGVEENETTGCEDSDFSNHTVVIRPTWFKKYNTNRVSTWDYPNPTPNIISNPYSVGTLPKLISSITIFNPSCLENESGCLQNKLQFAWINTYIRPKISKFAQIAIGPTCQGSWCKATPCCSFLWEMSLHRDPTWFESFTNISFYSYVMDQSSYTIWWDKSMK